MENQRQSFFAEFVSKNAWALIIVIAGIIAQWAIFGVRLSNIEERQDRQGSTISSLQSSVAGVQTQYAALNARLDGIDSNVNYIRSRIDSAIK